MTHPPSLLCIGLTTVDVVALPLRMEPFDGVRLIDALQMAPAGTAADIDAALVAAEGAFAAVKARRAALRPAEKLQAFRR